MSKFTDFYPAAVATGFPFTGSAEVTGSVDVTGSVSFTYRDTAGSTSAGTWSAGGNLIIARRNLAGTGTQTAGLAFGGFDTANTAATEEYNSGTWSNAPSNMIIARRALAGTGTQTAALAFGGQDPASTGATEQYNSGTWSSVPSSMIIARSQLAGAGAQTAALGFGGGTPAIQNATEEFNTTTAGEANGFFFNGSNGITTVQNLVETSALRYKENIRPIDSQLGKIAKLKPVTYNWKANKKSDIGFIAEDINNVYPEFVKQTNKGEAMGVNYAKMVSVLVKTLQEQDDQIQSYEDKIKNLKK